jgi:hypothetical protein
VSKAVPPLSRVAEAAKAARALSSASKRVADFATDICVEDYLGGKSLACVCVFFFDLLVRCRVGRGPACCGCAHGWHSAEGGGRCSWLWGRGVGPRGCQGRGGRGDPPAERGDGGAESGDGGAGPGSLSYTLSPPPSFFCVHDFTRALQVADFASRAASGALTAAVSAEVERLRTQHADAVREKSASDSKCRKLTDKVAVLEKEKADLRRQLAAEKREANEAIAKQQAAQAEAKLARAEGNLAKELAEHLQERLTALENRAKGAEAAVRAEAERTCTQLMDTYRELGARTGDFEVPDREPGLRCLQWVQEELQELPAVVGGGGYVVRLPGHLRGGDERALPRRVPALRGLRLG